MHFNNSFPLPGGTLMPLIWGLYFEKPSPRRKDPTDTISKKCPQGLWISGSRCHNRGALREWQRWRHLNWVLRNELRPPRESRWEERRHSWRRNSREVWKHEHSGNYNWFGTRIGCVLGYTISLNATKYFWCLVWSCEERKDKQCLNFARSDEAIRNWRC